ncbi:hypothetical protein D3C79_859880 [compost metagenome]
MEGKPAIATATFALGARQGVFLTASGVDEHREISAYRAVAQGLHLFDGSANHQPVDVADGAPEQAVAHGAANFVDVHVQPP